jgi:hypothetical protein
MSDLMVTLVSLAWMVTAGGQAPAPKPTQAPQITQGAVHERNPAGDHAKPAGHAAKRKLDAPQNAPDAAPAAATAPGAKQRVYAGAPSAAKTAAKPQT